MGMRPGRYQHDRGHDRGHAYTVTGVARHSETDEKLVVDRPEYGDRSLWVGPLAMFQETVTIDEPEVPRFQCLQADGVQQ